MVEGTRREILEILLTGDAAATDIANELELSLQTVHRHLESLREEGYVRESGKRSGKTRPYKLYAVEESADIRSIHEGKIVERSLEMTEAHKMMLSILQIPQDEFHAPILSHLFSLPADWENRNIESIAVYGSVARGDATEESDIDLLFITSDTSQDEIYADSLLIDNVIDALDYRRVVSNKVLDIEELREGVELDSQFLRNVFDEMIIIYDPNDTLRESRAKYAG